MNVTLHNVVANSCEQTPVYLVQNHDVTQAKQTYIVTRDQHEEQKSISGNLKTFYENSGNLENSMLLNNVEGVSKTSFLSKQNSAQIGNNLKLANFLLAKNDTTNIQYLTAVNSVVLKPTTTSNDTNVAFKLNAVPKLNVGKKIVKIERNGLPKSPFQGRLLPKITPKQCTPNPSKHTSVQLLKLGGTYHSLNQLNEEQMNIVNQALKNITDPQKVPLEPTYDPVTNTKYIYKVVSPKELTVVGKNKITIKDKKDNIKKNNSKKLLQRPVKYVEEDLELYSESPAEIKFTRSGRKVKLPKQILPEETLLKTKNERRVTKNGRLLTCFQCSTEFASLYRLQRHYENYPTHIPVKIHSNLFHCLLAIIKSGSDKDRAGIFVQQLEKLIEKLKSLLPCLLKKIDGNEGNFCTINDDIGRLFDMNPGKYNLNMDALNCTKDKDGCCKHNPPKINQLNSDLNKPSQLWLSKHNEETANNENESEDCARINSVDKWPTVNKRLWRLKQQTQTSNAKRCRLTSDTGETFIELETEEFSSPANSNSQNQINPQSKISLENRNDNKDNSQQPVHSKESNFIHVEHKNVKSKGKHMQFYSTHFDIRSSPIKSSSTTFRKFQINPDKLANYEVQVIKNLAFDKQVDIENTQEKNMQLNCNNTFSDKDKELPYKETNMNSDLNFANDKNWSIITVSNDTQSHRMYTKPTSLIEPVLLNVIEDSVNKTTVNTDRNQSENATTNDNLHSSQGQSVSQFLDSLVNDCLSYPENEMRNNSVDYQLDLFTFNNT